MAQVPITLEDIIKKTEELSSTELETLSQKISELKAQQQTDWNTINEAELLYRINNTVLSEELEKRFQELVAIKNEKSLTSEQFEELSNIFDKKEELNIQRIKMLGILAKKKNQSLRVLMQNLGLLKSNG